MRIFELLAQSKNNIFIKTRFGISFLSQIHVEFIQVVRLGSTTKPKLKAPLYWFIFHVLSHYALSLELTHMLVNRLVSFWLQRILKIVSYMIKKKPQFPCTIIFLTFFGWQFFMIISKMNILQYF